MIIKEDYKTRADGVKLIRTYSDEGKRIIQNETGIVYTDAIDVENAPYTYSETDEVVELTAEEALEIILGGEGLMITRAKALKIRSMAMSATGDMDDAEASTLPEMFPRLKQDGSLVAAGTRISWNGTLVKAATDLWDTAENNPDNAPNLWVALDYINGYRAIPQTITVTTAFSKGEQGWWKDCAYESVFDGPNVWNPEQFPAGWKKL